MEVVKIVMVFAILGVAVFVVLSPRVVYAPQPRVVLFFLMSIFVAILLGSEVTAQLKLELPGFCLVSSGAAAVCFGMLWLLNHLSKPEVRIAVFSVYDEEGKKVDVQWKGALEVEVTNPGITVTKAIAGFNTVVLIFPEQVEQAEIQVRKTAKGGQYAGKVSYAGGMSGKLRLGQELKAPARG